mgnify:CR=1 FL=1
MLLTLAIFCCSVVIIGACLETEVGSRLYWAAHSRVTGSGARWAAIVTPEIQVLTSVTTTEAGRLAEAYLAEHYPEAANS